MSKSAPNLPITPSRLCDQVRRELRLIVTDRTIRTWRSDAFIPRKKVYEREDVLRIVEYATLLMQIRDRQITRDYLIQLDNHRQKENQNGYESQFIDVQAEAVA